MLNYNDFTENTTRFKLRGLNSSSMKMEIIDGL